jgi:hypothetical protein
MTHTQREDETAAKYICCVSLSQPNHLQAEAARQFVHHATLQRRRAPDVQEVQRGQRQQVAHPLYRKATRMNEDQRLSSRLCFPGSHGACIDGCPVCAFVGDN